MIGFRKIREAELFFDGIPLKFHEINLDLTKTSEKNFNPKDWNFFDNEVELFLQENKD